MTTTGRVRGALGILATATLLAACGSSSGGVSGGTHDSPDGAVRGFVNALTAWDGSSSGLASVTDWIAPQRRQEFTSSFALLGAAGQSIHISFKVENFNVTGVDNKGQTATVHVTGSSTVCYSGTVNASALSSCNSQALSPSGSQNTVETLKASDGKWYVDSSASGGGSSTDSGTDSAGASASAGGSGSPAATDTGSAGSTDTGGGTSS